ncbi:MAG: hypothetical protein LBB19_02300 [Puniceicoccales bacterium]|jgi:hypothetical protein|nr:hypothetical protein [Puniceicoccales bacterium]
MAVIRSSNPEILQPLIEEQLKYKDTHSEWDVILDRIKQIKDRLNIDVQIKFQGVCNSSKPIWCLFTPNTWVGKIDECNVIIFEIWYDVKLTPLHRPVLDKQNALQAVDKQGPLNMPRSCELPPYIMLSHEMLHMLLRLEYILASSSLSDVQGKIIGIQNCDFKPFNEFLDATYPQLVPLTQMKNFFELWGAGETQREELIVMLGGTYTTETAMFILGETQFLRERYQDQNIISWTHYLFDMIADAQGEITHRKFLDNAFQLQCVQACLEAFPLKN